MAKLEIEISSKALEKGIDLAKSFLSKLVGPAIEETGLLLKDQVTLWRVINQVKLLQKSENYCKTNNIKTKTISLKLLCPLLEQASLEEDEVMQDKWAYLLGNMVDTEQSIDNHVLPYILGQLSLEEFLFLEHSWDEKLVRIKKWMIELENHMKEKAEKEKKIQNELSIINDQLKNGVGTTKLHQEKFHLESQQEKLKTREQHIKNRIVEPQFIDPKQIKGFQLFNLIRLGLLKAIVRPYINTQTLEIPNRRHDDYLTVDFDMDIELDFEDYVLTELGELFIKSCKEKKAVL